MTRKIKRALPFPPPYGRELPLPSEVNSYGGLVGRYQALWIKISREKLLGEKHRQIVGQLVDRFFDSVSEEQGEWLESLDLRWKKPRAVLVKERALQIAKREEGNEILKEYSDWLEGEFEGLIRSGKETRH